MSGFAGAAASTGDIPQASADAPAVTTAARIASRRVMQVRAVGSNAFGIGMEGQGMGAGPFGVFTVL